jgi:hypothetical protein
MKIVLFFSSGVASKMHKAKRQEVEDSMIEVLKHAPHMPGGSKYKVIICVHTYIYICVFHQLWFKPHKHFDFEVFSIYELNTPNYLTIFLVKVEVIIFMCRETQGSVEHLTHL